MQKSYFFASGAAAVLLLLAASCTNQQSGSATIAPAEAHADDHALHNVHAINKSLVSGSGPYGPAAFDELKAMGIKSIISVDGGTPEVENAAARGMRYVHVPITYATVTPEQQMEIARAIRDLPGPVYIHCHHGKHRGPAAAAAAAVALGMMSPEEGVAFMKKAQTADNYTGLYACVAAATVATPEALEAAPSDFPPVRKPQGMVAAMVEVNHAWEHLGEIRAAGWKVPEDHPDLVPAAEAGRLTDHLRFSGEDPRSRAKGEEYARLLMESIQRASALEEAIVANRPAAELNERYRLVQASCKDCHTSHRDH